MHMTRKLQIKAQSYWTKKETAFFLTTVLPKSVGFHISTVSPPKWRKNPNNRKDMEGTEYYRN